jgi:hypothetical protein
MFREIAMDVSSCGGKVHLAMKVLKERWDDTKAKWHDPVSKVFEEQHLGPLEDQIVATLRAIDRLGHNLRDARRDCS